MPVLTRRELLFYESFGLLLCYFHLFSLSSAIYTRLKIEKKEKKEEDRPQMRT